MVFATIDTDVSKLQATVKAFGFVYFDQVYWEKSKVFLVGAWVPFTPGLPAGLHLSCGIDCDSLLDYWSKFILYWWIFFKPFTLVASVCTFMCVSVFLVLICLFRCLLIL